MMLRTENLFHGQFVTELIKNSAILFNCRRRGSLMVSALDSGSGPGALCSWARHFTLIVSLSTQVYILVMQRFRVVYGISHESLVFPRYTHVRLGECVYEENTSDK